MVSNKPVLLWLMFNSFKKYILAHDISKIKQVFNRAKFVQKLSSQDSAESIQHSSENDNQSKEKAAVVIQSCKFFLQV